MCARVYIYQFPIEIARDLKWFTILSKAPTEGSENHFLSIFVILDHDAGVQSDDLRYLIPSNVRKTKHIFTFISLNREFIRIDADLKPGSWNRFCLLVDKTRRHFSLYFNDKTVYQTKTYTYPREIDQGNLWVLGFEKVGVGEAQLVSLENKIFISPSPAINTAFGALTDMQIWDRSLRPAELREWSESSLAGNILSWESVQFNNKGLIIEERDETEILPRAGGGGRIINNLNKITVRD